MKLAESGVLDNTTEANDRRNPNPSLRGTTVFARSGKGIGALSSAEAGDPTSLLDYAAFALDQEAQYCQQ